MPLRQLLGGALTATLLVPGSPALADPKPLNAQTATAFFVVAQDDPVYTPQQMAERAQTLGADQEAVAADVALNGWKQCVQDALLHWAPLAQGPGILIDGAYGRCAEAKRDYRDHLTRMTPGGRAVIDVQLARNLAKQLEDSWRPRLTAIVLDQMLAKQVAPPPVSPPLREPTRLREERGTAKGERSVPERSVPERPAGGLPRGGT